MRVWQHEGPCVYRIYDPDMTLLYIGSTGDLDRRMVMHSGPNEIPGADVIHQCHLYDTFVAYDTIEEARAAEREAIKREAPLLNRQHNPIRWRKADQHTFEPVGDTAERVDALPRYSRFELMRLGLERAGCLEDVAS
jgi:predicted GIY-YIG superfamily endonuclease